MFNHYYSTAGVTKQMPDTVNGLPAGTHCAGCGQVVPYSVFDPTRLHNTAAVHVVPLTVYLYPAGLHDTGAVHIIPLAADVQPAVCHAVAIRGKED